MGFYGNTLAEAPQSFRRIQVNNYSNIDPATITAHQLEDKLILSGGTSIQLVATPATNTIQFILKPLDDYGNPIITNHIQNVTTEYGSYVIQRKTLATTGEGLVSHLEDINIPIATESDPGLMSAADKANLKTLLSAIEGKTYEVSFYNSITGEVTVVKVKENLSINVGDVPELPESTGEISVIGWKNTITNQTYNDAISLVNGVGAVKQNIFFTLNTIVVGGEDPDIGYIYFINTDSTLTVQTGSVGASMATVTIPDIIDDPKYKIYGWTQDGLKAIRDDEWSSIIIQKTISFNVLKEEKETATLITKIRLGTSQYATIQDATAFLDGATADKFGVVKVVDTITDPDGAQEDTTEPPKEVEGPIVPDIALATRLASKDQSGWLSKTDKQALDAINFMQGKSSLNFCTYLGSKMPGFIDNSENMTWVRINDMVFCSANLTVRRNHSASTNPDFDNHECGLTGFPFKFANKGIINIYIQPFNTTTVTENKVAKITELVGQSGVSNDNIYALFKMQINDIGQYVFFNNTNANSYDNHIPALDLDIQFSAMYVAEPLS